MPGQFEQGKAAAAAFKGASGGEEENTKVIREN
jgi:hypothetical protein